MSNSMIDSSRRELVVEQAGDMDTENRGPLKLRKECYVQIKKLKFDKHLATSSRNKFSCFEVQ